MKNAWRRILTFAMAFVLVFSSVPWSSIEVQAQKEEKAKAKVDVQDGRVYITSQTYDLVPGASETVLTTNNEKGTEQRIGFIMTVDAEAIKSGAVKPVATYKDYKYDGKTFGMQTVTDQAKAYIKAHKEERAIAGINADFYNLNTGEPNGTFIMEGKVLKSNSATPYIAILNDGTVEIRPGSNTDYTNVKEAVSGNMQILTNGVVTVDEGDYQTLKYSRTGVGVKADGSIVTYVTHGISVPTSCGETYVDVAEVLLSQGCVNAIMLDGGGSSTYASMREGEAEFTVKNNPSDGTPRTVSNCLIFTSTIQADGEFDHAKITPNNDNYTPSNLKARTVIQMEATGIDASGTECDLPENLVWTLADDSKDMGSIDAKTGLFTAAIGKTGTVTIQLMQDNTVVGSTTVSLVEPDEISFSGTAVSLNFGDKTDLGLTVKGNGIVLHTKDGDFDWTIKSKNSGIADALIGSVENNIFIAGQKQDFALEGTVTVAYTDNLKASIDVEIGKMPIVAMDFEDVETNIRGTDVVGLWDWGTTKSYFNDATEDQVYQFQNYKTFYYLQSTTYASDSQWINEVYQTDVQPWTDNGDGTVTLEYNGETCIGTKEATYGEHAQKWVSFQTSNGNGYYWRGYVDGDTWSGNYNAGGGSASAFLGADGYKMYVWHTNANPTNLASGELHGDGSKIVDETDGQVRFGNHALKLTYDFRNFSPTGATKNCNTYYRMTEPLVASGSPTGLGMWVYAPETMDNFWFWTRVFFWNGNAWDSSYIHFQPAGAEKTCQYTGVNWTGWTYVEADLAAVYDKGAIVDAEHPIQIRSGESLILMTYIPGGSSDGEGHAIVMGSKTKGEFYIDNVRWVYGTNVDDMDNPQIISAKANETALSTKETVLLDKNDIVFDINFTDPQGENYSGIDEQATQLYLDGIRLNSTEYSASADRAQTKLMSIANGEHTLLISICDNFGNRTEESYKFKVENGESNIPEVSIVREEKAELGGDYVITIESKDLDQITSVSTNITYGNVTSFDTKKVYMDGSSFYDDYGNLLTRGEDGLYYDANGILVEEPMRPGAGQYAVSSAVQVLGENLSGKIRNKTNATTRSFTAEAKVKEQMTADQKILTFTMPIPSDLAENINLPCNVTVSYTTKAGNTYTVTTGDMTKEIYAYYSLEPGVQVAGAESGTIKVITADGAELATKNMVVYSGETALEGSYEGNVFTTNYFVAQTAGTKFNQVYVADPVNKHYSYRTTVPVAGGAVGKEDILHYNLTLNATTGDSTTEERITWIGAYGAEAKAYVQFLPKTEYDVNAENPFANAMTVEGNNHLNYFATEGIAAYVNKVELSDLKPGTTYIYRAGDGVNWSVPAEFSTMAKDDSTTKFMVMADVQLGSSMSETDYNYLSGIANATKDVDFGIQTGDFTDNPDSYVEWDNILRTWQELFKGKDFVHVIGNHEIYGTGASNSTSILGLANSEKNYYSVEYGDIYVAVINQSADLMDAADWLVKDAAKTDCTWKILVTHQPIYYTNPNGSSDGHHKVLKVACDQAGIDFTFGGHDHSYARTEQLKNDATLTYKTESGTNAYVDKDGNHIATQGQGTVYYVCGDLGEKSREDGYKLVNNPAFHFAKASQDYDALYLTVDADENKITVNTWNINEDGNASLFDTFTMYTNKGICAEQKEHLISQDTVKYDASTGKLICDRCQEAVDPKEIGYTGFAVNKDGEDDYGDSQYYFLAGKVRTGFFAYGELFYYANEDGLIDHLTENKTTNTCTTNGNKVAYSPRYDKNYKGGIERFTGHSYEVQEDGSLLCAVCDHVAVDTANWEYKLSFNTSTYNGAAKMPAISITNPETGEKLEYATDGMGKLTDYTRVWNNNKNVGTATVVVAMNPEGDYTNSKGEVVLTLVINPASPKNLSVDKVDRTTVDLSWDKVTQATGYRIYRKNGTKWTKVGETDKLTYKVEKLNAGTDYTFAVKAYSEVDGKIYASTGYQAAVDALTKGGEDIANWKIKLAFTKTTYNGNNKRPTATVTNAAGKVMTKNVDYAVKYVNNKDAGIATVTITGIGIYEGTKSTTFNIAPQNIKDATIKVDKATYNGTNENKTKVQIVDKNGLTLKEGTDYTLGYSEHANVGTATVKITAKGNYTGTISKDYEIVPRQITEVEAPVLDAKADLTYTGKAITPKVTVKGLKEGVDFTVSYNNNVNVGGKAKAVVTGQGNYQGSREIEFSILPREIAKFKITDGSTYSYTGKEVKADLNVQSDLGAILVLDKDYVVKSYENNINKGTATVTIEGIGNYKGTASHQFTIESAKIDTFTVEVNPDEYVYDGTQKRPVVVVKDTDGNKLQEGVDYTVSYENNVEIGTATAIVTGIGNYKGTASRDYIISAIDINTATVKLSYTTTTYSGSLKTPGVTVTTAEGKVLVKDKDYKVAYENNKNAGTAAVVITGMGYYQGSKTEKFNIKKADLGKCTVSLNITEIGYTGAEIRPEVTVKTAKGTKLRNGTNYEVIYEGNVNPGTATVTVRGVNNYAGSKTLTFKILPSYDLEKCSAKLKFTVATYNGNAKRPSVTVTTAKGEVLKKGTDYTVEYKNNTKVGTATVLITGIGKYSGTITKTFTIRPEKVTNVSVSATTKTSIKVQFDRVSSADKYYVYVDGKYVGCTVTKNYYTIKNLKANTTYKITIKAVKEVNGVKYYSQASAQKTVVTKK